jgi:hypothetical protein
MPKPSKENMATIRQVSRFLNRIQSYLEAQWIHPRAKTYLDATVLTLLSKSLALARSTVWLVRGGFDEEAFGASRTLLELALNLRYITNGRSPENRAKRFVHFVAKIKMEWGRIAIEHFTFPASAVRKDMPTYKRFQSMERKFPKHAWIQASRKHAKGIWTMAMEPDRFEKVEILDENKKPVLNKRGKPKLRPFNWGFDYKVIYFWTSQFVHVTIDSLDNHDAYPGEPFVVYTQGSRPSRRKTDLGDMALFNTVAYMNRILLAGFRGLGQPYPDELSKPTLALLKSYAKEKEPLGS